MKSNKLFLNWRMIIVVLMALLSAACGEVAAPDDNVYRPCDHVEHQMPNDVGEVYAFPSATAGPNRLTVNEGNQMALGSGDFILYRQPISDGVTYLFGETLEKEGIKITAYQCGDNIGFDIDIYPLQTFAELMLLQSDTDWDAWSQAIKETSYDVPDGFVSISVGAVMNQTGKLMAIPAGLTIPHDEDWINPPQQQEGEVTTFHVLPGDMGGAISRIEYVPQPGWELKDTINETTADGDQFVIFVVSPTVSVVDLTPFGYKGPVTRLYIQAIDVDSYEPISLYGMSMSEVETPLPDTPIAAIVEIPVDPYDADGITNFLSTVEALVSNDYVWTVSTLNFHWEFDVVEGTLDYYFKEAKNSN